MAKVNPRNTVEALYYGKEPSIETSLIQCLNWYAATVEPKFAKEETIKLLKIKGLETVDSGFFMQVYALLRLRERGYPFNYTQDVSIDAKVEMLVSRIVEKTEEPVKKEKLQVEPICEMADKIETYFDNKLKSKNFNFDANLFNFIDAKAYDKKASLEAIKLLEKDFNNFADNGVSEYYSVGKVFARKAVEFFGELKEKINETKVRKSRVPKKISVDKQVASVKYQPKFETFESLEPTKVVGKTKVVAFDTAKRNLIVFSSNTKFEFKGTTLQNVDTAIAKTLRKPTEQLMDLMVGTFKVFETKFSNIKSVLKENYTPRFNENMIILKVT